MLDRKRILQVAIGAIGLAAVGCVIAVFAFDFSTESRDKKLILKYLNDTLYDCHELEAIKWTYLGEYDAEVYEWDMARRGNKLHPDTRAAFETNPLRLFRLKFCAGTEPFRQIQERVFIIHDNSWVNEDGNHPNALVRINDQELFVSRCLGGSGERFRKGKSSAQRYGDGVPHGSNAAKMASCSIVANRPSVA